MSDELYYIWDNRQCVGNCALWWGKDRQGYVCDLSEAGLYSKKEAEEISRNRSTDIPVPESIARQMTVSHVRIEGLRKLLREGTVRNHYEP